MLKTYEVKLPEADLEFLDGVLAYYQTQVHPDASDPMQKEINDLRVTLNESLPCQVTECDRKRSGLDEQCDQCEDFRREMRSSWERDGRRETERAATYEQDMRDAGRGHLLGGN